MHAIVVTLTALVGVFGVGGAIALAIAVIYLGPQAVLMLAQPLLKRFLSCRPCVAVTAALLGALAAYWLGHHQAVVECRAEGLNSRIAAQQADLEAARKAREDEANRANSIEVNANEQHAKDLEFIARLQQNPACGFDPGAGGNAGRVPDLHTAGAQPAAGTKPPDAAGGAPRARFRLPLPVVRDRGLPRQEPGRDAAPDR